jgi:hypothetical protein
MCLVKVKQEEDHVVPYRVVQHNRTASRRRTSRQSERRYSRDIVNESSPRPSSSYIAAPPRPSSSYVAAPPQKPPLRIPPPQPAPVFVQPPPAPMPAPPPPPSHISSHHQSQRGGAQYVEVSPRSSAESGSSSPGRSEYVYREREVRRERQRAYSPDDNPRYEHYRYVEPASSESDHYDHRYQRRDQSRQRSRSRGGYEDPRGSFQETNMRVHIGNEERRRRDYGR